MRDPFEVLGVPRDADEETVTKAYRSLARRYHPDTHPDDPVAESRMKEINAAYEEIKDIRAGRTAAPGGTGTDNTGDPFSGDFTGYTYRGFYSYTPPRQRTYTYRPRRVPFFWRIILTIILLRVILAFAGCAVDFLFGRLYRPDARQPARQSAAVISDYDPKGDLLL